MITCCPFCDLPVDFMGRCANVDCFMWFTWVPCPDVREIQYEVRNMCGEIVCVI